MRVIETNFADQPGMGTALSALLLGDDLSREESLLIYRPGREALFSGQDKHTPGFPAAVEASKNAGFLPLRRSSGGRAIVFHPGCMALSWTSFGEDALGGIDSRFETFTVWIRDAMRSLGLQAEIGELENEYCPGEWSVHIGGRKVAGVAQRVSPPGAQVSAVITLEEAELSNSVLVPVYDALGLPLDPEKTGAAGVPFSILAEEIKQQAEADGPEALWSREMIAAIEDKLSEIVY